MSRCVCGHTDEAHRHYRPGADCGVCGCGICPWFVDMSDRDELRSLMTAGQRIRLAESDAHLYRNLAALAPFAHPRPHEIPIPAQRRPGGSVAGQYAHHLKTTGRRR